MQVNVHYLTWDERTDDGDRNWDAYDIKDGDADPDGFDHYRAVLTLDAPHLRPDRHGDLDVVWDALNRGPHDYLGALDDLEERSMCVGDMVVVDDQAYIARAFEGFVPVDLDTDGEPTPDCRATP